MWEDGLHALSVLLLLVQCIVAQEIPEGIRRVTIPPLIDDGPPKTLAFREEESIEMSCAASGTPDPVYKWQFNGADFEPSGNDGRIAIQPGVGTLIFARPIERDEGIYQCFAENNVGIAVSVKVDLRLGILEPFNPAPPRHHYPSLGTSLTLKCTPPRSYPQPEIFWATVEEGERFNPIYLTDRITMDPEGNLHFANILPEDEQDGRLYVCIVQNKVMRRTQNGDYHVVHPQGEVVRRMPPAILWSSPTHQLALKGQTWKIKCIFSGSPTPRVTWSRPDYPMPRDRSRQESFGQELVIDDIHLVDHGKYECSGINDDTTTDVRRSFDLKVEAAPYWVKKPHSFDATEGETAVIECEAAGIPEPVNFWFINGIPISKVPADPRRVVETKKMTFYNVTKEDAMVVQCNCTNKHGYVYENAYLNVLMEPPIILTPPKIDQKVAEGQTVNLTCEVFGSPKPLVVWRKGNEQLTGGRFSVMPNGNLQISDVSLVDAGTYTCMASNIFDSAQAIGSLIVRRATLIQTAPRDVMVVEETEAKFTCTATTDPEEVTSLSIEWKKDGELIDYRLAQRMFKNTMDNSLTISGTISLDTGKYTCVASNGLDTDEMSAQLVVQGEPDPPNDVKVECSDQNRVAEIMWQPGKENYAPILNFIVQFNTTFSPDTWIDLEADLSQNTRKLDVDMSPYGNYTYRVLARNKIGLSPPSLHTKNVCRTEEDIPDKNPENVIGEGDLPDNLVVYWTPMPKIEHNGRDFKYIVGWRRADIDNAIENRHTIERPEVYHYVVPGTQPTYKPYYVYVKAKNAVGDAREAVTEVIGYSGEDEPLESPSDIQVVEDSVKGDEAMLTWPMVDIDTDVVRGFFRGFRVQFWKTSEGQESMREQDMIINATLQYPRPRNKRDTDLIEFVLENLPPFSEVIVQVRVLNKYYAGPASEQVYITTKEGVPGPPVAFDVIARGATHFELQWSDPAEPNGILDGYLISYQSITGLNLGRLKYREKITDPDLRRARLTGLQPNMDYRVYITATTQKGKGEPIFLDAQTTSAGIPRPPTFDITDLGEQFVIVQWEPSRSGNPGSVFYVQHRLRGSFQWMDSPDTVLHYNANVSSLDAGTTYQIRVVSKNGEGFEAPSEWQEFTTGGIAPGRVKLATAGWFYGIFAALILIILILILFVLVKRKRDEWWEKKEAEIEDAVRHLQAEEAAKQMGIVNQYAHTGSQEMMDTSHASLSGSDYKEPIDDDEESGDDDDDDEEYEQDYNDGGAAVRGSEPAPPQYGNVVYYGGEGQTQPPQEPQYQPKPEYASQEGYHPGAAAVGYHPGAQMGYHPGTQGGYHPGAQAGYQSRDEHGYQPGSSRGAYELDPSEGQSGHGTSFI